MPDQKNDSTCTVYIEHQTDGLLIVEAYTEFGLVHVDDRGWAWEAPERTTCSAASAWATRPPWRARSIIRRASPPTRCATSG